MTRALILSTSADRLGELQTGVWLEEVAAPFFAFKQVRFFLCSAPPPHAPKPGLYRPRNHPSPRQAMPPPLARKWPS